MSEDRGRKLLGLLSARGIRLPYDPQFVAKLTQVTSEGAAYTLEDIAHIVDRDQGLTAKVLTLSNSAYYGLAHDVTTVSRALTVLGLGELRNIVLAAGIGALAKGRKLPPDFSLSAYWTHQFAVAVAARELASHTHFAGVDVDSLYTSALLHDLGKLLVALFSPDDHREIAEQAAAGKLPWHEVEEALFGIDHGVIAAMVLRSWNFPEALVEPVNWHHAPKFAPGHKRKALLICLADAVVLHIMSPDTPVSCPWRGILAKFSQDEQETLKAVESALVLRDPSALAGLAA